MLKLTKHLYICFTFILFIEQKSDNDKDFKLIVGEMKKNGKINKRSKT